jgi:FkbM family methyltransferase
MIEKLDNLRIFINTNMIRAIKLISFFGITADSRSYWIRHKREQKWLKEDGELVKKNDFDFLNSNSVVLDIGGYTGEFIVPLFCKYASNIICYEPVPKYFNELKRRFLKNTNKVTLINKAVGAKNGFIQLNIAEAATSSFARPENNTGCSFTVEVEGIIDIVNRLGKVDLLSLNCEGAEYEILDELIVNQLSGCIQTIFVQFHEVENNSDVKRINIINNLSLTHNLIYDYEWVWTRFDLK